MPYVWTNGFRTWYEDEGDGFPLVFAHGHAFDRTMWAPQVERFRGSYRVITYDLRGHGLSEVPLTGYWPQVFASDLVGLLDGLNLERAVLVGNSVSGGTIEHFAIDHPSRVAGLVLNDTSIGQPLSDKSDIELFDRLLDVTYARGIRVAMEEVWLPGPLFTGARKRPEVMEAARRMCLGYTGQGYRDPNRKNRPQPDYQDFSRQLAALDVPMLFIYGELDYPHVLEAAGLVRRDLPAVEVVSIPDAGHLANMEEPEQFNAALDKFFQRCARK
jgi:3-oxoadipate enol-lactonase